MTTVASSQDVPGGPWSPLVSVIVPTHLPDPPYLGETLASVVGQEWARWEVIVVDDGSAAPTEALEELTSADPRISLVRAPKGGISRARNLGLEHARGELVAFLDSDDYWYPSHLSCAVGALAQHEEAVATYSAIAVVVGTSKEPFEVDYQTGPTNRHTALSGGNRPFIPSLVARRQVVEAVGGFDPQFDRAQDQDLIFKVLEQGPCLYIRTVTAAYRHHDQNVSLDIMRSSRPVTGSWPPTGPSTGGGGHRDRGHHRRRPAPGPSLRRRRGRLQSIGGDEVRRLQKSGRPVLLVPTVLPVPGRPHGRPADREKAPEPATAEHGAGTLTNGQHDRLSAAHRAGGPVHMTYPDRKDVISPWPLT